MVVLSRRLLHERDRKADELSRQLAGGHVIRADHSSVTLHRESMSLFVFRISEHTVSFNVRVAQIILQLQQY